MDNEYLNSLAFSPHSRSNTMESTTNSIPQPRSSPQQILAAQSQIKGNQPQSQILNQSLNQNQNQNQNTLLLMQRQQQLLQNQNRQILLEYQAQIMGSQAINQHTTPTYPNIIKSHNNNTSSLTGLNNMNMNMIPGSSSMLNTNMNMVPGSSSMSDPRMRNGGQMNRSMLPQSSPRFSPSTHNLALSSPAMQQAMMNANNNILVNPNSKISNPTPSPHLYAGQMRSLMNKGMQRPGSEQQAQLQSLMASARTQQEQHQLLASLGSRTYGQQPQKGHPPHIASRGPRSSSGESKSRYEELKAPVFAIAPQQSTRCFFAQPLHGLVDSPVYSQTPNLNQPTPKIASLRKLEPAVVYEACDLGGSRLVSLIAQIDPISSIDLGTEDFLVQLAESFIDQVVHRACKIAKNGGSAILKVEDVQLEIEQNWDIRVPGFQSQPKHGIRRGGCASHTSRLTSVRKDQRDRNLAVGLEYFMKERNGIEMLAEVELKEAELINANRKDGDTILRGVGNQFSLRTLDQVVDESIDLQFEIGGGLDDSKTDIGLDIHCGTYPARNGKNVGIDIRDDSQNIVSENSVGSDEVSQYIDVGASNQSVHSVLMSSEHEVDSLMDP